MLIKYMMERSNHRTRKSYSIDEEKGKYYEMFETQAHFYQESQEQEKSS